MSESRSEVKSTHLVNHLLSIDYKENRTRTDHLTPCNLVLYIDLYDYVEVYFVFLVIFFTLPREKQRRFLQQFQRVLRQEGAGGRLGVAATLIIGSAPKG